MTPDLLELTATLIDVPSVSRSEAALADLVEQRLRHLDHLEVVRIGDNVVARTIGGRSFRVVFGGHLDTVPPDRNEHARIEGDVLWGVGSADMKGGLAVMLELARLHPDPPFDVTYVFYAREEIAASESGLLEILGERPDLLAGDVALLGEPTDGAIEAGCQGQLRVRVHLMGARAHTARPWMGRNAIHRAGPLLEAIASWEPRRPVLSGCTFHESLQVVAIEGGVAGNVVPDAVELLVGHRFAPDRSVDEAEAWLMGMLQPFLEEGDTVTVVDASPAAPPAVDQPMIAAMIARNGLEVRAKLGWTDVARFTELGVPAVNFGPGDSTLAHTAGEHVQRAALERTWQVLNELFATATATATGGAD